MLDLPTRCLAVDTWQGDEHAGSYGEDVYESAARLSRSHAYGAFSRLLRMTFDEARRHFADGSIDLLHIDGLHTYDAVAQDFETWLPKLSRPRRRPVPRHASCANANSACGGCGTKLRAELRRSSSSTAHGLGVLLVGATFRHRCATCSRWTAKGSRGCGRGSARSASASSR